LAAHGTVGRLAGNHPEADTRLSGFRYLTFDCYGTLVDWRKGINAALGLALGRGASAPRDLLAAYLEAEKEEERNYKKYREVLRNAALRVSLKAGVEPDVRRAEAFAESVPSWPAFPDTKSALAKLRARGYRVYILSNVDRDLLEGTIRNSELEVDGYVTAEDTHSYKPAKEHWRTFMRRSGADRREILHVAQSIFHDILPTQEMGIASAWVNRYDEPLPPGAQPSYIADGLRALSRLLP